MKALVIKLNQKIALNNKNITYIEFDYIVKYLLRFENYSEVHLCEDIKNNKDVLQIKQLNDTNFNDYDAIYIFNDSPIIFGGIVKPHVYTKIEKIANYDGKLFYVNPDPREYFQNVAKLIKRKLKVPSFAKVNPDISDELVEKFTEKVSKMKIMVSFTKSLERYNKYVELMSKHKYYVKLEFYKLFDFFEFYITNIEFPINDYKKEYDLCYYGTYRGGKRKKLLQKYFDNDYLKKILIGTSISEKSDFRNCAYLNNMPYFTLMNELQRSYSSLVISDNTYQNPTTRMYEAFLTKTIAFVDPIFDMNKELIKNEKLRKICYVNSPEEIRKKLDIILKNNLYEEITQLQLQEFKKWDYLKIK